MTTIPMEIIFCLIQTSTNGCGDPHVHCIEQKDSNPGALKYRSCLTNEPIGASTYTKLMPFYHSKSTIHGPGTPLSMLSVSMEVHTSMAWSKKIQTLVQSNIAMENWPNEQIDAPTHTQLAPLCLSKSIINEPGIPLSMLSMRMEVHTSMAWSKKIQTLVQSNIAMENWPNEQIDAPTHTQFAPLCLSKSTINEPDPPFSMLSTGMESHIHGMEQNDSNPSVVKYG